jgi:hypothetical protein
MQGDIFFDVIDIVEISAGMGIQVVENEDLRPRRHAAARQVAADETQTAENQNLFPREGR